MNLRLKLLLPIVVVFLALGAFLHFVSLPRALMAAEQRMHNEMGDQVSAFAALLSDVVETGDAAAIRERSGTLLSARPEWQHAVIVVDEKIIYSVHSPAEERLVTVLSQSSPGFVEPEMLGSKDHVHGHVRSIRSDSGRIVGRLGVATSINADMASIRASFRNFLVLLTAALLFCLAVIAALTRTVIVKPIGTLVSLAERLAQRDFRAVDLPETNASDEVSRLVRSFSKLSDALRGHELQQRQSALAIRDLAYSDPTTGLPNKALLMDRLSGSLQRARDNGQSLALMFVDVDDFKSVNDFVGHAVGDQYLREFAYRLAVSVLGPDALVCDVETLRDGLVDSDILLARYGADEFLILFADDPDEKQLEGAAKRIQQSMIRQFSAAGQTFSLSATIGISSYPANGDDVDTLLQHADTALHAAKLGGRGDIRFFSDTLDSRTFRRLSLESSLVEATKNNEFALHYQTKVDLKSGVITGVEALARWDHPTHGPVSPAEFIPMSEQTGAIIELGEWVIRSACKQALDWQRSGLPSIRVAVNLSPRQLRDSRLVDVVESALKQTGLDPSMLELELTEGALIDDPGFAAQVLDRLKELGVFISVDDFGTGYSSLSYLHRLPIDSVKIDQSFVASLSSDESSKEIIRAIISMARSLNLTVVAEGVETPEQLAFLRQCGCDDVQGFYLSNPVSPVVFEKGFEDTVNWTLSAIQNVEAEPLDASASVK